MNRPKINYSVVSRAILYYEKVGYRYVEVPWQVSMKALMVTAPSYIKEDAMEKINPSNFVASGEQSFLDMIINKKLPKGKYCCATLCFRPGDDVRDGLHFPNFFKVELIEYISDSTGLKGEEAHLVAKNVDAMADKAAVFMENLLSVDLLVESVVDESRFGCMSFFCCDIVSEDHKIELGSYGYREAKGIGSWIYGTGVALPRLTIVGGDKLWI